MTTVTNSATENANDREWYELVSKTSHLTHATIDEVWDGMARALVDYLEALR